MDYKAVGNLSKRINSLALKESPLEYDDSQLRTLLDSGLADRDDAINALTLRVTRLEGLIGAYATILQQLTDGGMVTLGNNVLLDDGAA